MTIKRLYKTYGKRKIQVYEGKMLLGEITEAWHWICLSNKENHDILRKVAMENLWWLLHTDDLNEDVTELEAWKAKVERWDKGHTYGSDNKTSLFFEGEKKIALESINNK